MIHNICMCLDSIICNGILIFITNPHKIDRLFDNKWLKNLLLIAIIINNALCGVTTSIFLKYFNSILKAYASSIEIILTAALSLIILSIPISIITIVSIIIISIATYVYANNPIVQTEIPKDHLETKPNIKSTEKSMNKIEIK